MVRRPASARVLAVSDDLSELLVLRRVIRENALSVETARNAPAAIDHIAEHRFIAVVVDESLEGAHELIEDLGAHRPDMLRVVLRAADRTEPLPAGTEVVTRPFYAEPLRKLLTELALRVVEFQPEDDTLPTRAAYGRDRSRPTKSPSNAR
jgi:DNA-binding NtrC family response regulator